MIQNHSAIRRHNKMDVDIQTYRVRIGRHGVKKISSNSSQAEVGAITEEFFYGIIVAILLIIGSIESHPRPTTMEENIKSISEILADLKKGQDRMSGEMTKMSAAMERRITSVENIVQDVKLELENTMEKCRRLDRANARWEHESRLNNIIIFGLGEEFYERNGDTCMINPSTEERNNHNSQSPRQDRRSFRSTSAEGRKNTEENSRVSITQRRSSSKSPIREHQAWSLQTSPRYTVMQRVQLYKRNSRQKTTKIQVTNQITEKQGSIKIKVIK
ncbi:hypothetical protein C0J52_27555 [Blattella germanica]|nr:hypothetical protein C0J52_27555 [Blattella germanica]